MRGRVKVADGRVEGSEDYTLGRVVVLVINVVVFVVVVKLLSVEEVLREDVTRVQKVTRFIAVGMGVVGEGVLDIGTLLVEEEGVKFI